MLKLELDVVSARADLRAATPTLVLRLQVAERTGLDVQAVALRCQVRIEAPRRRYTAEEEAAVLDLFGERPRWGDTMRSLLWMHASTMWMREPEVDLVLPCTCDFEVAATRLLHALRGGVIPLRLLFTGTAWVRSDQPRLQVHPVPWSCEASFLLPVSTWRAAIDACFPDAAWLRLDRETFEALQRWRAARGCVSWEEAVRSLLAAEAVR